MLPLGWNESPYFTVTFSIWSGQRHGSLLPEDHVTFRWFMVCHYHSMKLHIVLKKLFCSILFPPIFSGVEWMGQRTWVSFGSWSLWSGDPPEAVWPRHWPLLVCHVLLGHRGDQPHPPDPGVHVHVSRNNQCERQGGAEDVLCEHRNVKVPFPEQLGILKSCLHLGKKTVFSGRYNALFDCNLCPSFLMCVLCSVLWSLSDLFLWPWWHIVWCLTCAKIALPLALCLLRSRRKRSVCYRRNAFNELTKMTDVK